MKKTDGFGENIFHNAQMKKYLDARTRKAIFRAKTGGEISAKTTEKYAKAVCKWALKRGVNRFTHRFQPLNNCTAGKRDSLVSVNKRGNAVVKFRGKELKKGEGDASSFPNGGIRQTFEARGITTWDCTAPCYISDGCLCVPTCFVSNCLETLDKKTPLLRSCSALNKQAMRLLRLLKCNCHSVFGVVGAEQEYFLVDKAAFLQRPDLLYTGRTLFGTLPPKTQQLQDHYYNTPNEKVLRFWQEVDSELAKLGIVVKTEHREVAPSQFELAPCYSHVNLACEQNRLVMETLQKVADKMDLVCLLHEKPFENINGSGKHNNWSLLTDTDVNLFELGSTAKEQARFLLFLASVIAAVDTHADLLRFSVASASNDCRLGGFEAPPQIISVFLGKLYPAICEALHNPCWKMGRDRLPKFAETTDRNRTSPFAYTGNKFEFRMVGSSASLADCNTVLNTIVADTLQQFADKLQNSKHLWQDAKLLVADVLEKHGKVVFDGNNYSEQWHTEAEKRGLANITDTPQAIACLEKPKNFGLFCRHNVFSNRELEATVTAAYQNYAATVTVEAATLAEMCTRIIAPALDGYVADLCRTAADKQNLHLSCKREVAAIKKASAIVGKLTWHACKLKKYSCCTLPSPKQQAEFCCNTVLPQMRKVRQYADMAEEICPAKYRTLPTYGDLLYGSCNS